MIKKYLATIILIALSIQYNVAFAQQERHKVPRTCDPKVTASFTSESNFAEQLDKWEKDITKNTNDTVKAITDGTDAVIKTLIVGVTEVTTSNTQAGQDSLERELEMHKELEKIKREYLMQKEEERRREGLGLTSGETREEIEFIQEFLEIGIERGLSVREVEALILSNYDDDETITIGVASHSGRVNCSEDQINDGLCTIPRKITPAQTMMAYFEQCNQNKIAQVKTERESRTRVAAISLESERSAEAISNLDPNTRSIERREQTKGINCTPELKISGFCGEDISEEDFQEKMVRNQIITNGQTSPTNAFSPSDFGGLEYGIELTPENVQILKDEAYDYSDFDNYEGQNPEQVPIIYTYRNSSQLKAALSYVDTIVNDSIVANQSERFRNLPRSAEFQARYNSRIAGLNLVRNSFTDSVRIRTGDKLGRIWSGQEDITLDDLDENNVEKESYLGAGELDILINEINSAYQEISLQGGVNPADQQNKVEDASEKYWLMENYKVINLQNQVLLRQMLQNERMELLKAAQLQNMINSPTNIQYLNNIRNN